MKRIEQDVHDDHGTVIATLSNEVPDDAVVLSQPGDASLQVAMNSAPFVLSEADRVAMLANAAKVGEAGRALADRFAEVYRTAY